MSWWERWQRRQQELARGADADLVRDYRRKSRWAFGLTGAFFLLWLLTVKTHLPALLHSIIIGLAIASLVAGKLLDQWAGYERDFVERPDPEEPPSILRS